MKAGWRTTKLSEYCDVIAGQSPEGKYYNSEMMGLPFYQGKKEFTKKLLGEPTTWTTNVTKEAAEGDILMSVRAPVGPVNIATERICIGRGLAAIRPKKDINRDFLFYFFLKHESELVGNAGAVFNSINKTQIESIQLPTPPLPEQHRIVSILDEAFEGIATATANAEKNRSNAREVFDSTLQSIFTQIGKGWVEKSVGELVTERALLKPFDGNHGEIHPHKSDYTKSGVPFVMASDLKNGHVDTENCTFISRKLADSLRVGFAKNGDVLISHKGTIGRSAIVSTEDDYIMLTPQVTSYRVINTDFLINRFLRYYFMSPIFQREMVIGAEDGSTRAYIGITKQLFLRIRFPPLKEQCNIVNMLDQLLEETQCLENGYIQKLNALEELKKSILHQAFNGQLH